MCQQALEKLLKAIHLKQIEQEAPRTHNLLQLYELLQLPKTDDYLQTMGQLNAYCIKERYPAYKQKLSGMLDKETAQSFLNKTEEIFQWLKAQM